MAELDKFIRMIPGINRVKINVDLGLLTQAFMDIPDIVKAGFENQQSADEGARIVRSKGPGATSDSGEPNEGNPQ